MIKGNESDVSDVDFELYYMLEEFGSNVAF